MEIKYGIIIIDGVLHKLVSVHGNDPCSHCSLHEKCNLNFDEEPSLCTIIAGQFNPEERFVNCGKVTVTPSHEESKNVGEIYRNGVKIDKEE